MNPIIQRVLHYAAEKHKNQKRRVSNLPYIIHPVSVAFFLINYKIVDDKMICASILHDTIEDTNASYSEIKQKFGINIARLVQELTSNKDEIKNTIGGKNVYLMNKMVNMTPDALTIKLCDRLSNISDNPTEKYIDDTRKLLNFIKHNYDELKEIHYNIIYDIFITIDNKKVDLNLNERI